eukprot:4961467-Prymnesium_polylepis.1
MVSCTSEHSVLPAQAITSPIAALGERIGLPTRELGLGRSALDQPGGDGCGVRSRPLERGGVAKSERGRSPRGGDCTTCVL